MPNILTDGSPSEVAEATAKAIVKAIVSGIPFAGASLATLMEIPGNIEQIRINKFIIGLVEILNFERDPIDLSRFRSEDAAVRFCKIVKTGALVESEDKIKRFQKILLGEMKGSYISEFFDTFLQITASSNDTHIMILMAHLRGEGAIQEVIKQITPRGTIDGGDLEEADQENPDLPFHSCEFYSLDHKQHLYYVQDLISKSLLYDEGINRIEYPPFRFTRITAFGEEYLTYLRHYQIIANDHIK